MMFFVLLNLAEAQESILWMSWKEGIAKAKEQNKKVIVSLHTSWCGWCKKMDSQTFENKVISQYINDNYVAIRFDGDQRDTEEYLGKEYGYNKGGRRGYHELAARLTNGQLKYPSTVFLGEDMNIIQAIPGYQSAPMLETVMSYFAKDLHKSMPWISYQRAYRPKSVITKGQKQSAHTRLVSDNKN